jgi:hypothetical protein
MKAITNNNNNNNSGGSAQDFRRNKFECSKQITWVNHVLCIQYSLLGRTAASVRLNTTFRGLAPSPSSGKTDLTYNSSVPCFSTCRGRENQTGFVTGQTSCMLNQFCLRMGTELVPETLYSKELTRLCAREDYIDLCMFGCAVFVVIIS